MKRFQSPHNGFTLIEMLLVIVIILILAGLLLGGINMAIRKAETNKAQTTAFQLATAFRNYQSEYGTWPDASATAMNVTSNLVVRLTRQDATNNTRGIVFLEVEQKSFKSDGYRDPWGLPYRVQFDQTYSGSITNRPDGQSGALPAGVLVWSYGPKGSTGPTNEWVKSW
jgi:prepilin-type N-terminal cleavage/methylation domain-containing protein